MSAYHLDANYALSSDEVRSLRDKHFADLQTLSARYLSDIDPAKRFHADPEYLDALGGFWTAQRIVQRIPLREWLSFFAGTASRPPAANEVAHLP